LLQRVHGPGDQIGDDLLQEVLSCARREEKTMRHFNRARIARPPIIYIPIPVKMHRPGVTSSILWLFLNPPC
jgi:hypothetical protein